MFTIYLTTKCNFKCSYCYESYDKYFDIEYEKLIEILDFIFAYDKKKQIRIGFMGGEPLLKKDLIYQAVKYIETHYSEREVKYYITTNCSLVDKEFLLLIKKYNFNVRLSFDGSEKTHNLNRISKDGLNYYDIILKHILEIRDLNINSTTRMTVAENTIEQMYDNIKFLHNNGLDNISMIMDINMNIKGNVDILSKQYDLIADYYISEHKAGRPFSIDQFDGKFMSFMRDSVKCFAMCGAGLESYSIMPDGNIYPCSYLTNNSNYCIGNIGSNIDQQRSKEIAISLFNRTNMKCKNCEIIGFCHGMKCGYKNYMKTDYINIPSEFTCQNEKIAYSAVKRILSAFMEDRTLLKKKLTPYFELMKLNGDNLNVLGKMIENCLNLEDV